MRLNVVDALSVDDRTTGSESVPDRQVDWITQPPPNAIRELLKADPPRNDSIRLRSSRRTTISLNTTRPPLNDVRVRRALSHGARSRGDHARRHGRRRGAGVQPGAAQHARTTRSRLCEPRNPERPASCWPRPAIRRAAAFPSSKSSTTPTQVHQAIAELVRKQWQRELGITVRCETRNGPRPRTRSSR